MYELSHTQTHSRKLNNTNTLLARKKEIFLLKNTNEVRRKFNPIFLFSVRFVICCCWWCWSCWIVVFVLCALLCELCLVWCVEKCSLVISCRSEKSFFFCKNKQTTKKDKKKILNVSVEMWMWVCPFTIIICHSPLSSKWLKVPKSFEKKN